MGQFQKIQIPNSDCFWEFFQHGCSAALHAGPAQPPLPSAAPFGPSLTHCPPATSHSPPAPQPPVPVSLLEGLVQYDSTWAQFWVVYYAWALGYAMVPLELQSTLKAKRVVAARQLSGGVRLLPLVGGAASACAVNAVHYDSTRNPWGFRPNLYRDTGVALPAATAPPLPVFVGAVCDNHLRPPGDQFVVKARASDVFAAQARPSDDPEAPAPGPGAARSCRRGAAAELQVRSRLPLIVNGFLGFENSIFVGPSNDAAQRKTGSIFRPFHCVEHALRIVRPGQAVVLLPGYYAPLKIRNIRGSAEKPVHIVGLGRVVIMLPHKLKATKWNAMVKMRNCSSVVLTGTAFHPCPFNPLVQTNQ